MPDETPTNRISARVEHHTVLLIDDEESIINALKRLLRKEGLRVLSALSAAAGLEALEREPVHLVITDQRMPGMEGTVFLRKVKERWPETVRVVLTGYADPALVVESINEGGVFRFFGKPWDDEELRTGIRQCIAQYDLQAENRRLIEQVKEQNQLLTQMNADLEDIVQTRTRSLCLAQEIVDELPAAIFCLSYDGDLILSNATANREFAPDGAFMPGDPAGEVLPPELISVAESCRLSGEASRINNFELSGKHFELYATPLGREGARGILLALRETPDE